MLLLRTFVSFFFALLSFFVIVVRWRDLTA